MTDEEQRLAAKLPHPALVGCLIYAVLTRPDAAYSISNAKNKTNNSNKY